MPTPASETSSRKQPSTADVESAAASATPLAKLSCQQLCEERANDFDVLENLGDFPVNRRAAVAAAVRRDLAGVNAQLKAQHCPPC